MADYLQDRTNRWLIPLLIAVIVIVPVSMVLVMAFTGGGLDRDSGFGMMGSWGGDWWLIMLIPAAVVVVIVVLLLIALSDRPAGPASYYPPAQSGDALAILDRRLASGEISVEEYHRLKQELTSR